MNRGQGVRSIKRMIKGFLIGASMVIPGVSGGTMAIILNIYDELLHGVSCFLEDVKGHSRLLAEVSMACLLGVVLLSKPMLYALDAFYIPMMYFFMGAIVGSLPPLYEKATISRLKASNVCAAILGAGCGICLKYLPEGLFEFDGGMDRADFVLLLAAGFVIAVALVLPGISASYMLLMLGIYDVTLRAIQNWNLTFLLPLIIGVLLGTFLTAEILERAMRRHPQFTFMLIIGFMLGSLYQIFPGMPETQQWLICIPVFLMGAVAVLYVSHKGTSKTA